VFNSVNKILLTGLVLALLFGTSVAETLKIPPQSPQQLTLSYAPVVKRVAPAVVNIYTRKVVRQRIISPFFDDPFFQQFFGLPQGLTRERMENSLGSGVIVRSDGLIVTSRHVIAGADEITVVLPDRREFEAEVVTADDRSDLALLSIEGGNGSFPFLELKDSDDIEVGDLVLAVGNPFGVGQTVTSGIVSAKARTSVDIHDINYFIQTDAAINPGNSGGALVTMDGRLVGINSAIVSRSGGNIGIGFAVPSNMVRAIIRAQASGQKKVLRPWTGIEVQDVTPEMVGSLALPGPNGALINSLHPASPARGVGLRAGDVIVALNGKGIEDAAALRYRLATLPIGSEAVFEILRKGQRQSVSLKLIAPPEDPPREETLVKGRNPLSGAVIANISPALGEELNLRGVERGVVIIRFSGNSIAAGAGLKAGDIIQRINGVEIETVKDALAALQQLGQRGWNITVRRGDSVINLMVGG